MNTSNRYLVDGMITSGVLYSPEIVRAFRAIDRKDFTIENDPGTVYRDAPLPIGYGQTISQPSTVAFMLELLGPKKGKRSLMLVAEAGGLSLCSERSLERRVLLMVWRSYQSLSIMVVRIVRNTNYLGYTCIE